MYAIIDFKGKQYKVEKGKTIAVDFLHDEKDSSIEVPAVLMMSDGDKVSVGTPYVEGAKVVLKVGESFRDKKVLVFKYKSKKDYHRLIGHRQNYTRVLVDDIIAS